MQFLKGRWALVVGSGLMVISFQNCSKIGHNGVAFQGEALELTTELVIPPAEQLPEEPEIVQPGSGTPSTPGSGSGSNSGNNSGNNLGSNAGNTSGNNPGNTSVESPGNSSGSNPGNTSGNTPEEEPSAEIPGATEPEIAEIVALCRNSEKASGFSESRKLHVVHESLDFIIDKVSQVSLVHSRVVLRGSGDASKIDQSQVVHSDLVLCGVANIEKIRSTQSRVFVVGGTVQDANLVHSSMILINAELKNHSGVKSVIKFYSLH